MTLEMESEGQRENCFVIKSSDNLGVKVKEEEESKVTIFLS